MSNSFRMNEVTLSRSASRSARAVTGHTHFRTIASGRRRTLVGVIFGVGTTLGLALIAHHPTVGGLTGAEAIAKIRDLQTADKLVHGALITIVIAFGFAMSMLADCLGNARLAVRAGQNCYAMGVFAMVGAMLIDGFVIPDVATTLATGSIGIEAISDVVMRFGGVQIQILTKFGLLATALAIGLFSVALFRDNAWARASAVIGFLGCAVTIIWITVLGVTLTPHSLRLVFGTQAVWYASIAVIASMQMVPLDVAEGCDSGVAKSSMT